MAWKKLRATQLHSQQHQPDEKTIISEQSKSKKMQHK